MVQVAGCRRRMWNEWVSNGTINDEDDGIKKNTNDFFSAFESMQFFVRHLSLNDSIYSVEMAWLIVGYVLWCDGLSIAAPNEEEYTEEK